MGEKEDGHGAEGELAHDQLLTDPDAGRATSCKTTKVDALAVAIGTSHGAYKFTRKPTGDVLAMDRIKEIHRRLPNTPPGDARLVVACRRTCRTIINKYGGKMKQTWGVPVEEIQRGIKHGVRKINIDTDNRLAMTGAIRKVLRREPRRVRPAQVSEAGHGAMRKRLHAALRGVRLRRPGRQDQAAAAHGRWPSATPRASWPRRSPKSNPTFTMHGRGSRSGRLQFKRVKPGSETSCRCAARDADADVDSSGTRCRMELA